MNTTSGTRAAFTCDACRTPLVKRTSALQHPHLRSDAYVCQNPLCGATYTGHSELTGISSPSGVPNAPACELPRTSGFERALLHQSWKRGRGDSQLDWIELAQLNPQDNGPPHTG
ncbi:TPA: ogr/Delta-like zinc finger family protein [Stenotrophomonas maltophilia]|uniref:ogr/Delta-like zinc finger family protein n=1 Tax=Stenotrophomonas maltophilia TaxID=40324 RepID=UPI0013DA7BD0|nr:ogr/Delta-like zinc finger family protein [Stenotrophomonas maltophilia]